MLLEFKLTPDKEDNVEYLENDRVGVVIPEIWELTEADNRLKSPKENMLLEFVLPRSMFCEIFENGDNESDATIIKFYINSLFYKVICKIIMFLFE